MDSHLIGGGREFSPTPDPIERSEENSVAVAQFMQLMRGDLTRQAPVNRGVVELRLEVAYCLGCYGVHSHDIARNSSRQLVWYRCRFCGKENGQ